MASGMTLNGKEIFESDWIGAADMQGRDVVVEIEKVEKAEVFNPKTNKKSYKLALRFKGKVKGFICNRTNATSIAKVTGKKEASLWVGQKITLYPTTCKVGRETEPCLRVRESVPAPDQKTAPQESVFEKLKARISNANGDDLTDIDGSCGSCLANSSITQQEAEEVQRLLVERSRQLVSA